MAFLAPAAGAASLSLRAPICIATSSGRRSVKATASSGSGGSPAHPVLSSLRMAASAAVLLAATSPALACTPSAPPSPPTPLTTAAHADGDILDASQFQKLIVETAELAGAGDAEAARARLSAAEGCCDARLLAAQALFVDGKAEEAIAALEELAREDPADYRPLFCQSVLYRVLGKVAESESALELCRAVSGDAECCAPALMVSAVAGAGAVGAEKAEPETAEV
ncbi:unnamed protein product [Urochloa decumbens]|uniref:Uncharacterized protein n=1 Tax=Urochloa decumbens TaxID=240449 RepID=A0ABC8VPE3_9POAL